MARRRTPPPCPWRASRRRNPLARCGATARRSSWDAGVARCACCRRRSWRLETKHSTIVWVMGALYNRVGYGRALYIKCLQQSVWVSRLQGYCQEFTGSLPVNATSSADPICSRGRAGLIRPVITSQLSRLKRPK